MSTPTRPTGLINVLRFSLFFLCFFALLPGCSKTGPSGSTGLQGSTGAQGSAGPQGPQGNANVRVDTFSLVSSQWLWNDNYLLYTGSGSYTEWFTRYYKATFPAVTQGVLDSGMVMVYMTPDIANKNQWSPLPYTFDTGNGYSYDFVYVTGPGTVELEFFLANQSPTVTPPTLSTYVLPNYSFKCVAVTGTIAAAMQKAGIDKGNYAEVSAYLNLSDPTHQPLPNLSGAGRN
jgi:hypothetical protein